MPVPRSAAGLDLRGFDPLSRYLTFATAEALREAGSRSGGAARSGGAVRGARSHLSPTSAHELDDSVKERGSCGCRRRLSFTRVVLNASTGAARGRSSSRAHHHAHYGGRLGAVRAGDGGPSHLSLHADSDALCVSAADEIDRDESPSPRLCEAGACLLLATPDLASPAESTGSARVRLARGPRWRRPFEREVATRRALSEAGSSRGIGPCPSFRRRGLLSPRRALIR
ncbi:MAG: hypothetical protein R3B70_11425 [Polyangiaceae bacterium]